MKKLKALLITSSAYSNSEIVSDFGLIPPSFLPIGHRRLIELQIESIKDFDGEKIIGLPDNFKLLERDKVLLSDSNISIFRSNPNASLADAILRFIYHFENEFGKIDELFILHGDTLFKKLEYEVNLIYYGLTDMFYKWGDMGEIFGDNFKSDEYMQQKVMAGYFSFNQIEILKIGLEKLKSFELAIKYYDSKRKLTPVLNSEWLDFGHSNLYYKSKMELNVARFFNEVIPKLNFIVKTSTNKNKIKSEFGWFKNLPEKFLIFSPAVWGFVREEEKCSYNVEFIGVPTLQEKWVFGNLPDFVFYKIIDQIFHFIEEAKKITNQKVENSRQVLEKLYIQKTKDRLLIFSKQRGFELTESIWINNKKYPSILEFRNEILTKINRKIANNSGSLTLMHGDLCFSNIFYDSRSNVVKLIDPRGGIDDEFESDNGIFGDFEYDVSKLGHSLVGNYDYIVTGFYDLKIIEFNKSFEFSLQHEKRELLINYFFFKVEELGLDREFILASIANLFLSMLPLHNEDPSRQIALLCNAYKLYYD